MDNRIWDHKNASRATVGRGEEGWTEYYSHISKKWMVQYDYRAADGELFSCVANSLEAARRKRYEWAEARAK